MATTANAPQVPVQDQAYSLLHQRIHQPAFFNKLAQDYNIRPSSQQEALDMLTSAAKLRTLYEAEQVKAAAAKRVSMSTISRELDQQLAKAGCAVEADQTVKRAAQEASQDPQIAAAVLILQQHASRPAA